MTEVELERIKSSKAIVMMMINHKQNICVFRPNTLQTLRLGFYRHKTGSFRFNCQST